MKNFDDTVLGAYVDGELDFDTTQSLEGAMVEDSALRQRVQQLRGVNGMLLGAFSLPADNPIPQPLRAQLDLMRGKTSRVANSNSGFSGWRTAMALAASLAVLMIGLGGGYIAADYKVAQALKTLSTQPYGDSAAYEVALGDALERTLSGQQVNWINEEDNTSGTIIPVRTYRNKSGQYCREFRDTYQRGSATDVTIGIACRLAEGGWKPRYRLIVYGGKGNGI